MEDQNSGFNFVALKLCVVLGGVYAIQVTTGLDPAFSPSSGPIWKFFTSIFGHSDLEHLLNNLFFLGLFGSLYERFTSGKIFLSTFLASALFANFSAFLFFPQGSIIGASGGATGVMSAFAVYQPRRIGLALGVPLPMWAVLIAYLFINFAGLTGASNVAHEAHLLGMVSGVLTGLKLRNRPYLDREERDDKLEQEDWRQRIRKWEEKWMLDGSGDQ